MFVKAGLAVLIAAASFAAVGIVVPDEARVERKIEIAAPKERVLPLAAEMLGCGPGHVSPAAGCAILADGLKRTIGSGAFEAGRIPGGHAKIELFDTTSGVLAVMTFSTELRAWAPVWAKPFAAYRGLFLQHEVGDAFQHRLETLKSEAEKA